MRLLSQKAGNMQRAPIRIMLDAATQIPDAIHLEIGQPSFPTPPHIVEAAVHAARHEYTGYTANAGMIQLREAIVHKLQRENGLRVTTDQVIVTIGAMQGIYGFMAVLLDDGDEVLIADPGYGNFVMATSMCGGVARRYPTIPEQAFVPDFGALERLVSPRTKALLVNSPCNPTGAVYSASVLRQCLEFCRNHDLYLISDETYERLVFEGEHISPAIWDDEGRVVSVFSVSKTYSMTGWRVGYVVANEKIVATMTTTQEPMVSCANTVAQHAATAALLGPQDCVAEMLAEYRRRRDLATGLAEELGLAFSFPHGAFYLLVDISSQPYHSLDFAQRLLAAEHVAVCPGCAFGEIADRYVRISLCAGAPELREGLTRLASYLRP